MMMEFLFFSCIGPQACYVIKLRYGCLDMVGLLGHEVSLPPDGCSKLHNPRIFAALYRNIGRGD
jgi:hypothetical protein